MAHSEKKRSWFGKDYTQHYDDSGNKSGKSFEKKNILTNKVKTVHTDQSNNKTGSSENVKDAITGKQHTQHFDEDGTATSYTERKKNFFGKYKSYTKSGKKRTTQDYLAYLILIGIAIYLIIKVVLPLAFVLITPIISVIALINYFKTKDKKYFKYSLVCSTLFVSDYVFNGYSSYLVTDESFVSHNLYAFLSIAFVCFSLSLSMLLFQKLTELLTKINLLNPSAHVLVAFILGIMIIIPLYFIDNKFTIFSSSKDKIIKTIEKNDSIIVQNTAAPISIENISSMVYTGEDTLYLDTSESYMKLKFVDYFKCGMFTYLIFEKENQDTINFNEYNNNYKLDTDNEVFEECNWQGSEVTLYSRTKDFDGIRIVKRNEFYKVIYRYVKDSQTSQESDEGFQIIDILPFGVSFPRQAKTP